jgi:hypothetical protein
MWLAMVWGALLCGALAFYLWRALARGAIWLVSARGAVLVSKEQRPFLFWMVFGFYSVITAVIVLFAYLRVHELRVNIN